MIFQIGTAYSYVFSYKLYYFILYFYYTIRLCFILRSPKLLDPLELSCEFHSLKKRNFIRAKPKGVFKNCSHPRCCLLVIFLINNNLWINVYRVMILIKRITQSTFGVVSQVLSVNILV